MTSSCTPYPRIIMSTHKIRRSVHQDFMQAVKLSESHRRSNKIIALKYCHQVALLGHGIDRHQLGYICLTGEGIGANNIEAV
jgi:hypothetical protein